MFLCHPLSGITKTGSKEVCDDGDGVDGVGSVVGGASRIVCRVFIVSSDLGALWGYCRGLLSDLPRKSVEPIALQWGTPVRTLQRFLPTSIWDHERLRDLYQQRLAASPRLAKPAKLSALSEPIKSDDLGTIGLIDETSVAKKGDVTPGVQRQ